MQEMQHECGVAMIRLLKPLEYYQEKYGSWQYGLGRLYLMMEKQHNRGQEGAGIGVVNSRINAGEDYIHRGRSLGSGAIRELFDNLNKNLRALPKAQTSDPKWAAENIPFAGNTLIGHLLYNAKSKGDFSYVHPFLRRSNWRSRSLMLFGNFSLTNTEEIYNILLQDGQHPRLYADTFLILEMLGDALDKHVQSSYDVHSKKGLFGEAMNAAIAEDIDLGEILQSCSGEWDGGYVLCGLTGNSNAFAFRDPWGIRNAFYYYDDEVVVLASERPVIQTAFNLSADKIKELEPGQAMVINHKGKISFPQILAPNKVTPCSFERIYFSRGSDIDIYQERKMLGRQLVQPILRAVDDDLENTVFSFIPNTAEVAFFGMMEGFDNYLCSKKKELIAQQPTADELEKILSWHIRQEKVAIKDIKLRTFITEGEERDDLATHVYDISYGSIKAGQDNLVIIDDSIVRGTTLKRSILKILDRLQPKKIVVVSSSPQVRYPDYYGIDMSSMDEFIAFRAAVALLRERGQAQLIDDIYHKCKAQENLPKEEVINYVQAIYEQFSDEEISAKMVELLTDGENINAEVELVYQSVEGLHKACPNNSGDWYFTGNYPTAGGNKCVNRAYIEYMERAKS